jgi:putative addiction module component (TIGR02574 family)
MTAIVTNRLSRDDVAAMTVEERLQLIEMLLDSLGPADLNLEAVQDQEVLRRIQAYERDPSGNTAWDDLRLQLAERRRT